MKKRDKIIGMLATLTPFICIIVLWIVSSRIASNASLLPSLKETFKTFFRLFGYIEFYKSFFFTLLRSLIAFSISFLLSVVVAVLSRKSEFFKKAINPVMVIIRTLPTIAVVLLLLVWTNSEIAPIIVTFLVIFPTLTVNVSSSFNAVDKKTIEMCNLYGLSDKTIYKKVIFPAIKPELISAIGAGISLNLKLMVAAEVLAYTSNSIGNYLSLANLYDETAIMMALVMVVVLTGLVINFITTKLVKRCSKWKA